MPHVEPSIVERAPGIGLTPPLGRIREQLTTCCTIARTSPTVGELHRRVSSRQNRSVSIPCVVTTGTRANNPAIASFAATSRRLDTAAAVRRTRRHAQPDRRSQRARRDDAIGKAAVAAATSADRNASLPEPMSRNRADGCARAILHNHIIEQRCHQCPVRAEMTDETFLRRRVSLLSRQSRSFAGSADAGCSEPATIQSRRSDRIDKVRAAAPMRGSSPTLAAPRSGASTSSRVARCRGRIDGCRRLSATNGSCTTTRSRHRQPTAATSQRQNDRFIPRCPNPWGTHCTTNRLGEGYASSMALARSYRQGRSCRARDARTSRSSGIRRRCPMAPTRERPRQSSR